MRRYLIILLLLNLFLSVPMVWAQEGDGAFHEGLLVLSGDQQLVVDGSIYHQRGDMELYDNAQLIIRNGGMFDFVQDYHEQYSIHLYDNSRIVVENATMQSEHRYYVDIGDAAQVRLVHATVTAEEPRGCEGGAVWTTHGGQVVFEAIDSAVDMLYLGYPFVGSGGNAQVSVTGGSIDQLSPDLDFTAAVVLDGWRQGQVMSISLGREETGLPYSLMMEDVMVKSITVWARGQARVTIRDSLLDQLRPDGQADIRVVDSRIVQLVPNFDNLRGEEIIEGLRPGHFDSWVMDLRSQGGYILSLENSVIGSHVIRPFHVRLTIRDSEIGQLRPWADAYVTVEDSRVESIWFWNYQGTTVFRNAIVYDLEDIRMYPGTSNNFWIRGEVTIHRATLYRREMGDQWLDTIIHREYPVRVVRDGVPIAGVSLSVHGPEDEVIWTGESDENGEALFSLTFDRSNYRSAWTLSATDGEVFRDLPVYLHSSTPLVLDVSPNFRTPTPTMPFYSYPTPEPSTPTPTWTQFIPSVRLTLTLPPTQETPPGD